MMQVMPALLQPQQGAANITPHPQTRPRLQASDYRTFDRFETTPTAMPQVFNFFDHPAVPAGGRSNLPAEPSAALPQDRPRDIPEGSSIKPAFDAFGDSRAPTAAAREGAPPAPSRGRLHSFEYKTYDPFEDAPFEYKTYDPFEYKTVAPRGPDLPATAAAMDLSAVQQLLRSSIKRTTRSAASEAAPPPAQPPPDRAGCEPERASNPGSVGHPEMCAKVCIYFAQGTCENRSQCGFCHCSHSNFRKSSLDKTSRGHLRRLHYSEAYELMMPVAAKRMSQLGVDLRGCRLVPARGSNREDVSHRKLVVALGRMGIRALLTQMSRLAPEGTVEEDSAKNLLHALNEHCRTLAQQQ